MCIVINMEGLGHNGTLYAHAVVAILLEDREKTHE